MSEVSNAGTRVTVVIVGYKSRDLLPQALAPLEPLRAQGFVHCIVVDNASNDGTSELLRSSYPGVELIINHENIGFGRACNVGIERSDTEYVLLLNPDAILSPEALAVLVDHMDSNPKAGIAGPSTTEEDGYVNPLGVLPTPRAILSQRCRLIRGAGSGVPILPGSKPTKGDWLCGAVLLLRKRMLDAIGGFDPRFFLYFEETDLCKRALIAGWEIWGVGESIAYHVQAASSRGDGVDNYDGCIASHYFPSRYHYVWKHHGFVSAFLTEAAELAFVGMSLPWRWGRGRGTEREWTRLHAPKFRRPPLPRDLHEDADAEHDGPEVSRSEIDRLGERP